MILEFEMLERWVGPYHSLHWELLKKVDIELLNRVGVASVRDLFVRIMTEDDTLNLSDFPLRGRLCYPLISLRI
jgi:E3 ubiquitin-protein ligase UBR1